MIQLRKQLKRLKKGNEIVDSYMRRAKTIFDQLAAYQAPVTEDSLIKDIWDGLGIEFRPFTRTIETTSTTLSFDALYALLLNEESNLIKRETESVLSAIQWTTGAW